MTIRRAVFAALLPAFLAAVPAWSRGSSDAPFADAEGLRNWEHSFDIEGKKAGVYNIVVEGRDSAGNVTVAGPINVRVDPKTDLPVAVISNPLPLMRVAGDLNLVGTCADDDGVSRVEYRVDAGEWQVAEGGAFWSKYFRASELEGGRRKISVRGVDVNGLVGPERSVLFDMDKNRPLAAAEAPLAGALVGGVVAIRGTASDENAVVKVDYSVDGGKTFAEAKGGTDKKTGTRSFSANIDTRKLPDGPAAIWLRSTDGVGSVGEIPVLVVVDNTKPVVELVSPAPGEKVDAAFNLFGFSRDEVALASLSWKVGDLGGTIPLTRGDDFWSVPVKLPEAKGKDITLVLTAVDTSGNKSETKHKIELDLEADRPRTTILEPAPAFRADGAAFLAGYARDDDGVAAVEYWVDKGSPVRLETTGAFGVELRDLATGKRVVSVRAVDLNGVVGPAASVEIESVGRNVGLEFRELVRGTGKGESAVPFSAGMEYSPDLPAALRLRADGGDVIETVEWRISGIEAGPLSGVGASGGGVSGSKNLKSRGPVDILIPLPADGPYGALSVEVTCRDAAGRTYAASSHLYATNLSAVRGEAGFVFVDERLGPDGSVRFAREGGVSGPAPHPLRGRFVGATLSKVELEPRSSAFSVSADGPLVTVSPAADSVGEKLVLVATTDRGHVFRSAPFTLVSDVSGPELSLDAQPRLFVGDRLTVAGRAADPNVAAVRVSIASSSAAAEVTVAAVPAGSGADRGRFEASLDLSSLPDGPLAVEIVAADGAGNESRASLDLLKDTEGPAVQFVFPTSAADNRVAAGYVSDPSGLSSVEFTRDGSTWERAAGLESFVFVSSAPFGPAARLKAVDRAGNERTVPVPFAAEAAAAGGAEAPAPEAAPADPKAVPAVSILYPASGTTVTGPSFLVFSVTAPRPLASVSWSFGKSAGTLDPATLASLPDGSLLAAVAAAEAAPGTAASKPAAVKASATVKDAAGKSASAAVACTADPARSFPSVSFAGPEEGAVVGGDLEIRLSSSASGGIASYRIVLDKEAPREIPAAAGASLALASLAPGAHVVSAVAVDALGRESILVKRAFKVVGPAPVAELTAVSGKAGRADFVSGAAVVLGAGGAVLEGRASAPNGLSSVTATVGAVSGIKGSFKKEASGEFSFSVPLSADLPYDRSELRVELKDAAGKDAAVASFLYRVAAAPATGTFDADGLALRDPRVAPSSAGTAEVTLSDDRPLAFRFNGRPLAEARLDGASGVAAAAYDGSVVTLAPGSDGIAENAVLRVKTVDGDEFFWGPARYIVDRGAPTLELETPVQDGWYRDAAPFSAAVSDALGSFSLSYTIGSGESAAVDPSAVANGRVTLPVPLPPEDGAYVLRFRIVDSSGRPATVVRVVNRDAAAPSGSFVVPRTADAVNGRVTTAVRFSDSGSLASVEFSVDGQTWEPSATLPVMAVPVDFFSLQSEQRIRYRATDRAGNSAEISPEFVPDAAADKPRAAVQLPTENEVVRTDFSISGAAYDDDGIAAVSYRIDEGEWVRVELSGNGFAIPMRLADLADNEHSVTVVAEDIYGVRGDETTSRFRVSTSVPKAAVTYPPIDKTVRGIVEFAGTASDANGVGKVDLSFDNAVTFNRASGAESWTYRLDTRSLKDGPHSLYVRPADGYDIDGFFATLVSVDNTPPELSLDLPRDGAIVDTLLDLSGRSVDSRKLASCEAIVFARSAPAAAERRVQLPLDPVIRQTVDLSGLADGEYGVRVVSRDEAGNESQASRDFVVRAGYRDEGLSILSPLVGETLSGRLRVQGRLRSPAKVSAVSIFLDGADILSAEPDANGYFSADLDPASMAAGRRVVAARFVNDRGTAVASEQVEIDFVPEGPWVSADSFRVGAFVPYRPYLSGTAGWTGTLSEDKKAAAAQRKEREIAAVEVSVDNGRTFRPAKGKEKWKFRLETQEFPEGNLPLVVRSTYRNGKTAVSKLMLNLDKTGPRVELKSPSEGNGFNGKIDITGIASDDIELVSVKAALRQGDKAGYELPSFIQGLYLDGHVFGEPVYEAGIGVTFFDDNVKLQVAFGNTPEVFMGQDRGRFHGSVYSAKLIANILTFPFGFLLGPDWDFLSSAFALGANFSYFSETQQTTVEEASGEGGTIIGSVICQLEFPKISFRDPILFRSYSFYTEFQAWFVSAEMDGGLKPAVSLGVRTSVF
jgi:hypothetical protein